MGRGQGGGGGRGKIAGGGTSTATNTERINATSYVDPDIANDTIIDGLVGQQMTDTELESIINYTGSAHEKVNAYLDNYGGVTEKDLYPAHFDIINQTPTALSKLPAYEGVSYRRVDFYATSAADKYVQGFKKGQGVEIGAFISSTKDKRVFGNDQPGSAGAVFFEIRGKRGRYVADYSAIPSEKEVLFTRGSKFRVVNVSQRPNGAYDITLEQ